jgi:hypothetical protein
MEENNITASDLVSSLREGGSIQKAPRHSVWDELASRIPNRKRKAIYEHAKRLLAKDSRARGWTDEDKQVLLNYVKKNGTNWVEIARLLGRLDDDCKQMYLRSQERENKGKFTLEEDIQMVEVIREILKLPARAPITEFPDKGIPWKEVAAKLHNKRLSIDYLRHWPIIKRKAIVDLGNVQSVSRGVEPSSTTGASAMPASLALKTAAATPKGKNKTTKTKIEELAEMSDSILKKDQATLNWLHHLKTL